MWEVMFWPLVACVILPPLLVYLGLHVVQRGIIFIDIAMAQMASLGFCVGTIYGLELEDPRNLAIALGFTIVAAALFSFTNKSESEVPQEAIIGIAYVVAAATAVLVLSQSAHGDEEIKNMLVGNILLVTKEEIAKAAGLFAFVGLVHGVFRRQLLRASYHRADARAQGMRMRAWDFLFYALFGLVVTSFVRIAGVLLVFSYLIVPAVCAVLFARGIAMRIFIGCLVALLGGVGGLIWSFKKDLPTGAAIVCMLGALLVTSALMAPLVRASTQALRRRHA